MNDQRQRPGVMIYFDTLCPALARLTNEQAGALLRGIVDYAQTGAIPELDPMPGMAFDLLRPGIDRDEERYFEQIDQRRYAVYCRELKKRGADPISFENWQRMISDGIGRYPTTTPTSTSTPASTPTSSPNPSSYPTAAAYPYPTADAPGKGAVGGSRGTEGETPDKLFADWKAALDANDGATALSLANRLFALGFDVDKQTRSMERRR